MNDIRQVRRLGDMAGGSIQGTAGCLIFVLYVLLLLPLGSCSGSNGDSQPLTVTDSSGAIAITLRVDNPYQISVSWGDPTRDGRGTPLRTYSYVYRDGATITGTAGFFYTNTGLLPRTRYCYRAEVFSDYGIPGSGVPPIWYTLSWSSGTVCIETIADTIATAVISTYPSPGEQSVRISTAISVAFSEDIDPRTVDSSTFFVTGPAGNVSGSISIGAMAATFKPDVNLAYLSDYRVTVTTGVKDLGGHALPSPYTWTFTTEGLPDSTPPSAPSGLSAVADTNGQILLSWDPANDNTRVEGYKIYRDGLLVKSVPSTTATDVDLNIRTQYCYAVSAYDAAGNESQKSSTVCATATDDGTPPTAPSGLAAVADTNGQILLSWAPASDNKRVEGYKIYRDGLLVKSVPTTTATDIGLCIQTQYCYAVSAYDAAGNESQKSGTACATTTDLPSGSIGSWGFNGAGQLGDGTTMDKNRPGRVVSLATVSDIAAGVAHSVALKTDGTVWAWGDNSYYQLGDGIPDIYTDRTFPVQVAGLTNIIAVATKGSHTLALKSDGTVWAWGSDFGPVPAQIAGLSNVIAITASIVSGGGGYALKSDGTVWGLDLIQVPNLSGIIAIAAGSVHALALKSDGTVWAWGSNYYGQLGCGMCSDTTNPVQVVSMSSVTAIAAGQGHSIALRSDGTVWTWGMNNAGQLGDTTTNDSRTPVQAVNVSGIAAIAAGNDHTLALKSDGTIWAWGGNGAGALGDGTTTHRYSAVQTVNLNNVTVIRAGGYHSMVLK